MQHSVIVCAAAAAGTCDRREAGTASDLFITVQPELRDKQLSSRDAAAQRCFRSLTLQAQDLASGINEGRDVRVTVRSVRQRWWHTVPQLVGLKLDDKEE